MSPQISPLWKRAALLGSLWASVEIVLGSFLHNIRFPVTGTILASLGVCIMTAGSRLWPGHGLLWRTGLICAVMKSVSPSAVILGPMAGILAESLLMEAGVRVTRGRAAGLLIGGALAASTPAFQKVAGLLVAYGLDAARLFTAMYEIAANALHVSSIGPGEALLLYAALNSLLGLGAAWLGLVVASRARILQVAAPVSSPGGTPYALESVDPAQRFSLPLLVAHAAVLPAGLLGVSLFSVWTSAVLVSAYAGASFIRYRRIAQKFARPGLWAEFALVTLLAAFFLGGVSGTEHAWSAPGLLVGFQMVVRAALVIVAFSAISIELRNPRILRWFSSRGLAEVSGALGMAFQALPGMMHALGAQRRSLLHPVQTLASALAATAAAADRLLADPKSEIFLLTGEQASGKTSFLHSLLGPLRDRGIPVRGILSPRVDRRSGVRAYDVVNIRNGERAPLCSVELADAVVRSGPFGFDEQGLALGVRSLREVREEKSGVVVIDEIGPLELNGGGWASAAREHLNAPLGVTILVIRSSLLEKLCQQWNVSPTRVWTMPGVDREQVLRALARLSDRAPLL